MVDVVRACFRAMRTVSVAAPLLKHVPDWPSLSAQERVVAEVLDDPVVKQYPPSRSYVRAFMKAVITDVEGAGVEVAEELYTRYVEFCVDSSSASDAAELVHCTLTFSGSAPKPRSSVPAPDAMPLRLSRALNPVGLTTWPAGFFLTELLMNRRSLIDDKEVLELGAGVGITGIAIAKWTGVKHVTMTDYLENVIDNINHNIEINGLNEFCSASNLDWEEDTEESCKRKKLPSSCDLIIAADCVYDPSLATSLTKMLAVLLSDSMYPRAHVIIANTVRQQQSLEACFAGLQKGGITWKPIFAREDKPKYTIEDGITPAEDFASHVPQLFPYERPVQLILWDCFRE